MVTAHSGALAGEHGAYEALFDAHGVLEVAHARRDGRRDGAVLVAAAGHAAARGVASVHDSGGERALFVDVAHDLGVPFAAISEATRATIDGHARPGPRRGEPARRLGDGHRRRPDLPRVAPGPARRSRHRRDGVRGGSHAAGRALRRGLPPGGAAMCSRPPTSRSACSPTSRAPWRSRRPRTCATAGSRCWRARRRGSPRSGLLLAHRGRTGARRRSEAPAPVARRGARALARRGSRAASQVTELEGLALLADYGVPVIRRRARRRAPTTRVAAAAALGFPVVLKTAAPGVQHKSDVGGVQAGPRRRGRGARGLRRRGRPARPEVVVGPDGARRGRGRARHRARPAVRPAGARGGRRRPRGAAARPARWRSRRWTRPRARALVDRLKIRPLLDGVRGAPPADVDALARRDRRGSRCWRTTSATCSMPST